MFIVHREKHKSYGIEQVGYYVSWKDKLSDNYSDNWQDAKKYKTLSGAIKKLGFNDIKFTSVDDFLSFYKESLDLKVIKRDDILSKTLEKERISDNDKIKMVIKHQGKIEKINEDYSGKYDVADLVVKFILDKINKNENIAKDKLKRAGIDIGEQEYIGKEETEEFWDDFFNS